MGLSMAMVTFDCADPARLAAFWAAALDTTVAGDYGEFVMLAPPSGGSVRLAFQRVPEPKAGKNRVHLDLDGPDRRVEVARLVELGATVRYEESAPGFVWTTLADPEGNEFCVAQGH
ncbi:MAG: VOC family protein [Pseudonocardia sp.]|jgi:predicted enzyme related to lactoylglutathione lyase